MFSRSIRFSFCPERNLHPPASNFKAKSNPQFWVLPQAIEPAGFVSSQNPKARNWRSSVLCLRHFPSPASLLREHRLHCQFAFADDTDSVSNRI